VSTNPAISCPICGEPITERSTAEVWFQPHLPAGWDCPSGHARSVEPETWERQLVAHLHANDLLAGSVGVQRDPTLGSMLERSF
jgi:hypothetical protein